MPELCETFEALAGRTWSYLRAAHETDVRIGEETLTDINLIDIQDRHPGEVVTRKFTRAQEAANGADWEWWFIGGGQSFGARVQAKKLYPDRGYTSLYGDGRSQSSALLASASKDAVTPMYCFYNFTDPKNRGDWPLLSPDLAVDQMGCGLAPAGAVERAIVDRHESPSLDALGSYQLPWREIVCRRRDRPGGVTRGGEGGAEGPRGAGGLRLERVREGLAHFVGEYGEPEPTLISESDLPAYIGRVRTGEAGAYRRKVPARRVTIFELDR